MGGAGGATCSAAIARACLNAGMRVVIADMSQAHMDDAADRLADSAGDYKTIRVDVAEREAMARAADEAERAFGKVHVLCNNAGIGLSAPMTSATYADWDRMWALRRINRVLRAVAAHSASGDMERNPVRPSEGRATRE